MRVAETEATQMGTTRRDKTESDAQRAAFLCAECVLTQAEIGRRLGGLSQSRVSRLLHLAESRGWLERSYHLVAERLPAGRYDQLRQSEQPQGLAELLEAVRPITGVHVRGLHVVDTGSSGTSERMIGSRLARFAREAASPLDQMLTRSACVAVSWGRSVWTALEGLRTAPALRCAKRPVRVVPLCGEPLEQAARRETSTHLAEQLHEIIGSTAPRPPSLTGVPALIPRHFKGTDAKGIRKFVAHAASYREVFGQPDPLIHHVDTLLTSVGSSERPMGFVHDELLKAGGTKGKSMAPETLSALVAGDMGGVLLPRQGLTARDRREVAELNRMWTGATLAHYERIVKAAQRSSRPGIVLLSIGGPGRAEIVAEVLRHGLVNELVVDRALAEELQKVLAT